MQKKKIPTAAQSRRRARAGVSNRLYPALIILLLLTAGGLWAVTQMKPSPLPPQAQVTATNPARLKGSSASTASFVDEQSCSGCHEAQFKDWQGSHHQLAMQAATGQSVLGNFEAVTFTGEKDITRFFRKGDEFWVNTVDGDGRAKDFKVVYAFGVAPLQQYLLETVGGRLQALGVAWDTENSVGLISTPVKVWTSRTRCIGANQDRTPTSCALSVIPRVSNVTSMLPPTVSAVSGTAWVSAASRAMDPRLIIWCGMLKKTSEPAKKTKGSRSI